MTAAIPCQTSPYPCDTCAAGRHEPCEGPDMEPMWRMHSGRAVPEVDDGTKVCPECDHGIRHCTCPDDYPQAEGRDDQPRLGRADRATTEQLDRMRALKRHGQTCKQIASATGFSEATVRRQLRGGREQRWSTASDRERMRSLIAAGHTSREVADMLGVARSTVQKQTASHRWPDRRMRA